MYLSILNTFRVIQCLSQCVSPKVAIFTTFWFPLGTPLGNHAKCCMDGKRIRCLQIDSLRCMCPSNYNRFWDTARYWSKIVNFFIPPLHSTPPLGEFPLDHRHPVRYGKTRIAGLPQVKKFRRYLYSFWRNSRTWRTDRQTDRHRVTAIAALCIASHGKKMKICLFVLTECMYERDRHTGRQTDGHRMTA